MIFNIIGLIIGAVIFGGGLYYLIKEWKDKESRKIYGFTGLIGAIVCLCMILRLCGIL